MIVMVLTQDVLGNLIFLAVASVLTVFGDWKYHRGGPRGLWRDWVVIALLVAGAFAWASPAIYGPDRMFLTPVWTPVPVLATAGALHLFNRRRLPASLRLPLSALLFFALQTMAQVIA